MFRRLIPASLGFALLHAATPATHAQDTCITPAAVMSSMPRELAAGAVNLEGGDARQFLAAFNALPPQSDFVADQFAIIGDKRTPSALILAFDHGCLKGRGMLQRDIVLRIIAHILDSGA